MPRLRPRTLLTAAACVLAGAVAGPVHAAAAQAPTTAPCLDVAGILQVTCPAVTLPSTPAPPAKAKKRKKATGCANELAVPSAANLAAVAKATLCLVNKQRTKRHLVALQSRPVLSATATRFAGELVRERFFDHTAPDGTTMLDRIKRSGYLAGRLHQWWVGENIAYGTGALATPKAIVRAWMNSPGHRANILEPRFREIGLGVALGAPDGPEGATYVHDFGRRIR